VQCGDDPRIDSILPKLGHSAEFDHLLASVLALAPGVPVDEVTDECQAFSVLSSALIFLAAKRSYWRMTPAKLSFVAQVFW